MVGDLPHRPPRRLVPPGAEPDGAGAGGEGHDRLEEAAAVGEDGGAVLIRVQQFNFVATRFCDLLLFVTVLPITYYMHMIT